MVAESTPTATAPSSAGIASTATWSVLLVVSLRGAVVEAVAALIADKLAPYSSSLVRLLVRRRSSSILVRSSSSCGTVRFAGGSFELVSFEFGFEFAFLCGFDFLCAFLEREGLPLLL